MSIEFSKPLGRWENHGRCSRLDKIVVLAVSDGFWLAAWCEMLCDVVGLLDGIRRDVVR